jgi:radical SAM superfamily enzyme YgiQ (UPF0313 family)
MKIAYLDGPWPDFGHRTQRWAHKNPGGNINPPPLFQMYSAAIARQRGHDVALWDAPARGFDYDELLGQVGEFGPDLVVVNTSTPSFDHDMTLVRKLAKSVQAVRVLVGSHVSALPDDVMTQHPEVDIIATGEYDDTISDIAENLSDLSKIGGVVYRSNGGHARTGVRPLMKNLNELPFPAYDLVNLHDYRESMFPARKKPIATMWTSRGCNFHCNFCLFPQIFFQDRMRIRTPENIVAEIRWLKEKFGVQFFYFEDDNFTASWKRVETLAQRIIDEKLDITWGCLSRTDGVTPERLGLMKESGCYIVKFGIETGVEEFLEHMEKYNKISEIENAFEVAKKVNMVTHGTVMIGNAGETWDTIHRTRQFVKKLAPDSVQFSVCTPFPGTRFFDECRENGWLDYEKWEDFDGVTGGAISYPGLSKHDIQRAVKDSYLDYYSSLPHLRQRFRRILYGPERGSQMMRNLWLAKRFFRMVFKERRQVLQAAHARAA